MALSEERVGHLEEEAVKRKERLARLKRQRDGGDQESGDKTETSQLPKPVFRNYRATDEQLQQLQLADSCAGDVDQLVQPVLERVERQRLEHSHDNMDMSHLAPRKPDWDLKRALAPRLERLERRTQRAVAELIRQRLQQRSRPQDLVDAVAAASLAAPLRHDDDDVEEAGGR